MNQITKLTVILFSLFIVLSCKDNTKEICNITDDVNYTNHIASLVETHCFTCHAPDVYKKKASRNKIFDYASLKKMAESGQLIGSITHAPGFIAMPYRKGVKIDSCAIEVMKKWVVTGMKE
ncbi:hypothetical protein GCM10022393_23160 [Aquimarina addita]|uniref:Cytochrome C Planctomycete-type domain-containing protein n=1 Tax=Aquimarina addita TaxID=870485 RepID=A0ABP6UJJ6_9FLAO